MDTMPNYPHSEEARRELIARAISLTLLRACDEIGGATVTERQRETFCGHCDFRDKGCPDQDRYVFRNYCGWSRRRGQALGMWVTLDVIPFHGVEYRRDQLSELDEAIEAANQNPTS